MKKLMTMMALLASGVMAFGEMNAKFDASTATTDTWTTGWSGATAKATLDTDNNVLKISSGSDAVSRLVNTDASKLLLSDATPNAYFDVSLDVLGQAMDEVPVIADEDSTKPAKLALFLLDTTDIEGVATDDKGTNLYAIAGNPNGGKLLVRFKTDVTSLLSGKSRLTVQTYYNVLANTQNQWCGFAIYKDGGTLAGTITPENIDRTFSYNDDGTTVNWSSADILSSYLMSGENKIATKLSKKRRAILLSIESGVGGQSFTQLDFVGNVNVSTVESTLTKYDFIADDEAPTTANVTLSGVSITVDPAEAYDSQANTLSADCTITVKKDEGLDVLKYTGEGLAKQDDGTFKYTFVAGNDISFTAAAASVTLNGEAYETLAEALTAGTQAGGGTLSLKTDLNATVIDKLENGCLLLEGGWTLDLAGKNIVGTGEATDNHGVVYLAGGTLVITNSTTELGFIESTTADRPAVCCESEDAKLSIYGGIIKGSIRDIVLESEEEDSEEVSEGAPDVTPNVTIYGGYFTVEPNALWIAEGKAATKQTIDEVDYWVVGEQTTVQYTVTFVTPDPTGSADPTTNEVKVEENTPVTEETPTAVEGWTFLGWYVTEDGKVSEEKFDFTTLITANITLTAKWSNWATVLGDADTDGAYKIDDETDLKAFAANVGVLPTAGVTFKLTQSIALTEKWAGIGVYDKDKNASVFEGTFDGGNFTISNVVFADNASGNNYRGFFNQIYKATVKNLTVDGSGFGTDVPSGEYGCALVAGCANDSTIENCTAIGTIASGTHNVAGIVVRIKDSTVKGCTNKAALTCSYSKIGGIAAICQYSTTGCVIENCVNEGTLTADGNAAKAGVDGLAGILAYTCDGDASVTIKGCSNKGSLVKGDTASANAKVGQIIGYAYKSVTVDGENTGLADVVSVGKSDVGAIDGLTFATVDKEGTATFVANSAVAVGGTYKVMASGATYMMTALGSITFDTSLATVAVAQGGDYASEDDYSLTEAKDTTNKKVITYTLAAKATTPTLDPTKDPVVVKTEEDADKLEITVTVPSEVASTVTEETYKGYFKKSVTEVTDGGGKVTGYSVAAVLDESKVVPDDVAAEIAGAIDTITEGGVAVTTAKPGLYYSVEQGQTLDSMTEGDRVMAKSASVSIPATKFEGSGFYRVRVSVTAK